MAVAHYQFEAIHPFTDGNGRTGRILNLLMLVSAGVLAEPILYLSRAVIQAKAEYYRLLNDVTSKGAWEEWILYMIEAVRNAAAATNATIMTIARVRKEYFAEFHWASPGMANADFQAVLFAQPYCRIRQVMDQCGVSRPTAMAWLSALVEAEALRTVKIGRDRLYLNPDFLAALTGTLGGTARV